MRIESETHMNEFEAWLRATGLKEKTVRRHLDNVGFFLETYLPQMSAQSIEDGCHYVGDFLGYFLIRKCAWSTPATIRQNAASLKKFYRCMLERGQVGQQAYDELLATIEEDMDDWIADCEEFSNPSDDLDDPFASDGKSLFDLVYDTVAQELGLGDLLGIGAGDDRGYEDERHTRQEVINELTLALFYLTSWEEEPVRDSGIKVRRAWKSADWDALDWLRDQGFVDCSNKAKSVTISEAGVERAEDALIALGFDYLVETDDDGDDDSPAKTDETRVRDGWNVL